MLATSIIKILLTETSQLWTPALSKEMSSFQKRFCNTKITAGTQETVLIVEAYSSSVLIRGSNECTLMLNSINVGQLT